MPEKLKYYAWPYVVRLREGNEKPSFGEVAYFTISFSIGRMFHCFSTYIIGAFAARAFQPERTLPVYYAVIGLVTPVAFAASRVQALTIAFGRGKGENGKLSPLRCNLENVFVKVCRFRRKRQWRLRRSRHTQAPARRKGAFFPTGKTLASS